MTVLRLSPRKLAAVVAGLAQGADERCKAAPAVVTAATLAGRMGRRPRSTTGKLASKLLNLRVTEAELEGYKAAAAVMGLTVSEWLRSLAAEAIARMAGKGRGAKPGSGR